MKEEPPKKMGRPTIVTPEVVSKLEEAFAIGCNVSQACAYVEIERAVFYAHLKRHPEFQLRIDELQERPILKARKTIYDNLSNPETAKWFLERKAKKEFGAKTEFDGSLIVQHMPTITKGGKAAVFEIGEEVKDDDE